MGRQLRYSKGTILSGGQQWLREPIKSKRSEFAFSMDASAWTEDLGVGKGIFETRIVWVSHH